VNLVPVIRPLIRLITLLTVLASATFADELPATTKEYSFGLHTLNQPDTVRRKQVQFSIDSGMTEDELDSVNHVLDGLGATHVDADGNRELTLSNGTRVKIGGLLAEGFLEDSAEGVHSLPAEFSTQDGFSTVEAALVLQIASAGHLFVGSSIEADEVATTVQVNDKRFLKRHKHVAVTPDEKTLAEWIQQNFATAP
jgi:hypothetical protein